MAAFTARPSSSTRPEALSPTTRPAASPAATRPAAATMAAWARLSRSTSHVERTAHQSDEATATAHTAWSTGWTLARGDVAYTAAAVASGRRAESAHVAASSRRRAVTESALPQGVPRRVRGRAGAAAAREGRGAEARPGEGSLCHPRGRGASSRRHCARDGAAAHPLGFSPVGELCYS
jgi:hypothetical protein